MTTEASGERGREPLAGDRIDAEHRRGRDGIEALLVSRATSFAPMSPVPPMTTTVPIPLETSAGPHRSCLLLGLCPRVDRVEDGDTGVLDGV